MHGYRGDPQIWFGERDSFSLHVSPQFSINLRRTLIEWEYLYIRPNELLKFLDKKIRPVGFKRPINQFANSYCCGEKIEIYFTKSLTDGNPPKVSALRTALTIASATTSAATAPKRLISLSLSSKERAKRTSPSYIV